MMVMNQIAEVFIFMNGQNERQSHEIRVGMRKEMNVTGVKEVLSFDESCVVLKSACGEMTVEGSDLRVGTLDTDRGVVSLCGRIDTIYYTDEHPTEKRGLGRLFR